MKIDKPEYLKKKTGGIITDLSKSKADQRRREYLIDATVRAWYNIDPKYATWMMAQLKELTDAEMKKGEYANGNGYVSLRLPRELFASLRKVFQTHASDMPAFATTDDDIKILCKVAPKLMPGGFKSGSRKE